MTRLRETARDLDQGISVDMTVEDSSVSIDSDGTISIRDPEKTKWIFSTYHSGDNLHPNDAGYRTMAEAVELSLFQGRGRSAEATATASGRRSLHFSPVGLAAADSDHFSVARMTASPCHARR